ncbi:MAG: hypothetical protein AAF404_12755 [Pseudomonadota bacterium]
MRARIYKSGLLVASLLLAGTGNVLADFSVFDTAINYRVTKTKNDYRLYQRTINLRFKIPDALSVTPLAPEHEEGMPIIVYSHGGAGGVVNGHSSKGQAWSDHFAANGFITINIGHAGAQNTDEVLTICNEVKLSNADNSVTFSDGPPDDQDYITRALNGETLSKSGLCAYLKPVTYLRHRDINALLDKLDSGFFDNLVPDFNWNGKIGYVGHSAGSQSVAYFAGAVATLVEADNQYRVKSSKKFSGYIMVSPKGASNEPVDGFVDGAWETINQPTLVISGDEDIPSGHDNADIRRQAFDTMIGPDQHELWFTSACSTHRALNLQIDPASICETDQEMVIQNATLAFFNQFVAQDNSVFTDAELFELPGNNTYTDAVLESR